MRYWTVAGGLLSNADGLLLVANRRRDGRIDWSTPGGVVDEGESPLGALTREVEEETGLMVREWGQHSWTTEVEFVDLEMHLVAEVHVATAFEGALRFDDPDGIVTDGAFLPGGHVEERLVDSPPWVADPLREWMADPWADHRDYRYRAAGTTPASMRAERLDR